jgi:hypothetical protein
MHQLIASAAGAHYVLQTSVASVGYDATGATDDYTAFQHQARAFTVELDPVADNPGFLLPENQIMACFETNIRGALAAIAAPASGDLLAQQQVITAATLLYQGWAGCVRARKPAASLRRM